jgi:hypothetical protein
VPAAGSQSGALGGEVDVFGMDRGHRGFLRRPVEVFGAHAGLAGASFAGGLVEVRSERTSVSHPSSSSWRFRGARRDVERSPSLSNASAMRLPRRASTAPPIRRRFINDLDAPAANDDQLIGDATSCRLLAQRFGKPRPLQTVRGSPTRRLVPCVSAGGCGADRSRRVGSARRRCPPPRALRTRP